MKKTGIIILGIIIISFLIGIYFYPQMPDNIVSHWNAQGQADDYMPKFLGLFLMPAVSLVMFLLFLAIPKIDPLKANIEKFRKYYDWFIVLIILFLFYLYVLTIFWNLGFRFDLIRFLIPAFGLIFYYAGILIENAKRNWFIGIKTPWTLTSEEVWDKTHKIGGMLFKACGILALLGLLFPAYAMFLVIAPIILTSFYLVFYSYLEYYHVESH